MRKIVYMMSVSVDGYISGPAGELDWHRVDDEVHQHFNDVIRPMGGFLNGRRNFELMAEFWPTADEDPANAGPMAEFAGIWRDMPKVVYSRTLDRADWNATVVHEVVPAEVLALKERPGGDLMVGGAELAGVFADHGLIDEFRIYQVPVILGRGRPLLGGSDARIDLDLAEHRTFTNGVTLLRYARPEVA